MAGVLFFAQIDELLGGECGILIYPDPGPGAGPDPRHAAHPARQRWLRAGRAMAVTSPGGHAAGVLLYRIMSVKILVTIAWVG